MANKGWLALQAQVDLLNQARAGINGCITITQSWSKEYGSNWIEALVSSRYKTTQKKDIAAKLDKAVEALATVYDRTTKIRAELAKLNTERKGLKKQLEATTKRSKRDELVDSIAEVTDKMDEEIPTAELRSKYRDFNRDVETELQYAQSVRDDFKALNSEILPRYEGLADDPALAKTKPMGEYKGLFAVISGEDRDAIDDFMSELKTLEWRFHSKVIRAMERGMAEQKSLASMSKEERAERELKRLDRRDERDLKPQEFDTEGATDVADIIERAKRQVQERDEGRARREERRQQIENERTPAETDKRMLAIDKEIARLNKAVDEYSSGFLPPNLPFGVIRGPVVLLNSYFSEVALTQYKRKGIKIRPMPHAKGNYTIDNAFLFGWSSKVFNEQNEGTGGGGLDPVMILDKIRAKKVTAKPAGGPKPLKGKDKYKVQEPRKILDSEMGKYRGDSEYERDLASEFRLPKGGDGTLVKRLNLRPVSNPKRAPGDRVHSYMILLPALENVGSIRERADDVRIGEWDFGGGRTAHFLEAMATWAD